MNRTCSWAEQQNYPIIAQLHLYRTQLRRPSAPLRSFNFRPAPLRSLYAPWQGRI